MFSAKINMRINCTESAFELRQRYEYSILHIRGGNELSFADKY